MFSTRILALAAVLTFTTSSLQAITVSPSSEYCNLVCNVRYDGDKMEIAFIGTGARTPFSFTLNAISIKELNGKTPEVVVDEACQKAVEVYACGIDKQLGLQFTCGSVSTRTTGSSGPYPKIGLAFCS